MKKVIITILCILIIIIGILGLTNKSTTSFKSQLTSNQLERITPNDPVYYDLFITMLFPYVEEAIADYYNEYMTYPPTEAPWSYKFIRIERMPNLSYSFTVELEVQPYIGPHLSVGRDRITFKIELDKVSVEKFEHVESYELPPNYQDVINKKFPDISNNL